MKPNGKSVLLFSGGLDSIIFTKLLNPDVLLYVPMKGRYCEVERRRILGMRDQHAVKCVDPKKLVILENVFNFKELEEEDAVIPNRNAHLILLGANYGEKIYVCSVGGDTHRDNSEKFFNLMKKLLNYIQMNNKKCNYKVLYPFLDVTKTELVKMFLEKGGEAKDLLYSYSCYTGNNKHCGECEPCIRKFVALVNNGILSKLDANAYYENNPIDCKWVKDIMSKIKSGKYRGEKESKDFLRVYG